MTTSKADPVVSSTRAHKSRLLWRLKAFELLLWLGVAIFAARGTIPILREYGLGEFFRSRFYGAFGNSLAIAAIAIVVPLATVFILGSPPVSVFIATIRSKLSGESETSQGHDIASYSDSSTLPSELVVTSTRDIDALGYLQTLVAQSSGLAASSLRRSNVHLLSGVLVGAVGLIFFFVVTTSNIGARYPDQVAPQPSQSEPQAAVPTTQARAGLTAWELLGFNLVNTIPRLAILLFIELMAGFFLRQYRTAMEEFRYFEAIQRQREALVAAFLVRRDYGEQQSLVQLADTVLTSAAPGILKQGETTTIIETQKLSQNEFADLVKQLTDGLMKLRRP